MRDEVAAAAVLATTTLELGETPKRDGANRLGGNPHADGARETAHARPHLPAVTVNVVLVEEVGGPNDGTDVSWLLITSLPIGTMDEARTVMDYYVARWTVEIYLPHVENGLPHRGDPTGNAGPFEELPGDVCDRRLASAVPDVFEPNPSDAAVHDGVDDERMEVGVAGGGQETVADSTAVPWPRCCGCITRLGGYNNRKGERPPGPQSIWIGLRRMADFAQAWQTFGHDTGLSCV